MAKGNARRQAKDKRDGTTFLVLPHIVIDSPSYRDCGYPARAILIDIARQFTGTNNGRLVACNRYLKPLGWNSHGTITRSIGELLDCGLLIETRKGARPNKAAWYALGWQALDVTDGLDIDPKQYRTGLYKIKALVPSKGIGKQRIAPSSRIKPTPAIPLQRAMQ